ncbi:ribonuclease III [bacterium]|nr:ribonuclease III [bacterium]
MKSIYKILSDICQIDIQENIVFEEALSHKSWLVENPVSYNDYERLEFLGDAVLNFIVSDLFYDQYPDKAEGDLTQFRSSVVNESVLGQAIEKLKINGLIKLGLGEERSGGHNKLSILSDVFESLLAALYLTHGIGAAKAFVINGLAEVLNNVDSVQFNKDFKTQLQEKTQKYFKILPIYNTLKSAGPDHDKTFTIKVHIKGYTFDGQGNSKKQAQQDAAQKALQQFARIKDGQS